MGKDHYLVEENVERKSIRMSFSLYSASRRKLTWTRWLPEDCSDQKVGEELLATSTSRGVSEYLSPECAVMGFFSETLSHFILVRVKQKPAVAHPWHQFCTQEATL